MYQQQKFSALDSGHLEMVKVLYDHGADLDIPQASNNGCTPLCAASDPGYLEVVKFLLATDDCWMPFFAASDSAIWKLSGFHMTMAQLSIFIG
jgi:ankyrin repeat protein